MGSPAVFLDRDGVINRKAPEGEYIRSWREIELLPGAGVAVATLNRAGFHVFIVTNQRGVATGKIRTEDLTELHRRMKQELAYTGAEIADVYCCPHDIASQCSCRKPQPGMLQRAAEEYGVNLRASWMIGDSLSDVEAGARAGCRTVLLTSDVSKRVESSQPTLLANDLLSAVQQILNFGDPEAVSATPGFANRSAVCPQRNGKEGAPTQ
jgi:D-glycero-D-manno-heptose 1,7-bisphosphate phosphatase